MGFSAVPSMSTSLENSAVSLVAQTVKHLPAMRETWVLFLSWEDPLEKEMETHSSTLAYKIPWMEKSDGLQLRPRQPNKEIKINNFFKKKNTFKMYTKTYP